MLQVANFNAINAKARLSTSTDMRTANTDYLITLTALVLVANAGSIQLKGRQNPGGNGTIAVKQGSFLRAYKIT